MDLFQSLSDAEFDELEEFLLSAAVPEDCMDIVMLDGFLTALAVGPNVPLPSVCLPVAYGESEGEAVRW